MKIIVGLGNPGPEYAKTRHNVGYMVIDELAQELGVKEFKTEKKFKADLASADLHKDKIIMAKPTTFMNLSGEAVLALQQFYKVAPENIWVVYDDIDLSLGQIRVRSSGGPGTHNGMKSIVSHIGTDFPRFRIGTESRGVSAPKKQDTSSYVLSPFTAEEAHQAQEAVTRAAAAVKSALEEGIESAMNSFNH